MLAYCWQYAHNGLTMFINSLYDNNLTKCEFCGNIIINKPQKLIYSYSTLTNLLNQFVFIICNNCYKKHSIKDYSIDAN